MRWNFHCICIASYLMLSLAAISCQNDDGIDYLSENSNLNINKGQENDFEITDGKVTSPSWLSDAIDSVAKSHIIGSDYIYPIVFKVTHNSTQFYLVFDLALSSENHAVFTMDGTKLDSVNAKEIIEEENRLLIWYKGYKPANTTKAFISTVNVQTPNGSIVSDCWNVTEDYNSAVKATINQETAASYPNATILSEATTTYNCHSYAWNMTEGGSNNIWMGRYSNPTSTYWLDGSYISATSADGKKVAYLSDNHSAVTTSTPNIFISKWGNLPLMRHAKNYSPYDSSVISYLKPNDMPDFYIGKNTYDY